MSFDRWFWKDDTLLWKKKAEIFLVLTSILVVLVLLLWLMF